MYRKSRGSPTLLLLILAALLLIVPATLSQSVKMFVMQLFLPLHKSASSLILKAKGFKGNLQVFFKDTRDYHRLLERVQGLENQIYELKEVDQENRRLTELIEFKKSLTSPAVVARVIGWDTSAWSSSIVIDKGEKHGVGLDMAVVYESGLVGRVIETGRFVSRVLLITDPKNKVGARMQRSREIGVVQGASFFSCKMTYMSKFADVQAGDVVVTSGLSTFYPKGIPIGKISEVFSDDRNLYKYALLTPMVNFSQLEEVVVLKWKPE